MCASFSLWPIPIPFYHISFSGDGFSLTTTTVGKFLFFFGYAIIWHIHKNFFISYSPSNVFWISYDLEIINQ